MKQRSRANPSSLFLLELVLSILFFAVASAACVQLFIHSHILSVNARELNRSVLEVSSIAELTKATSDSAALQNTLLALYPQAERINESMIHIYYNSSFAPSSKERSSYTLVIQLSQEDHTLCAALNMQDPKKDRSIYALDVIHHLPRRDFHEPQT